MKILETHGPITREDGTVDPPMMRVETSLPFDGEASEPMLDLPPGGIAPADFIYGHIALDHAIGAVAEELGRERGEVISKARSFFAGMRLNFRGAGFSPRFVVARASP